jgi:hypothetical protein
MGAVCPCTAAGDDRINSSTVPVHPMFMRFGLKAAHDITLTTVNTVWSSTVVNIYRIPGTFMSATLVDVYASACG